MTDYDVPYECACCGKTTTCYLCAKCSRVNSDAELTRLRESLEALIEHAERWKPIETENKRLRAIVARVEDVDELALVMCFMFCGYPYKNIEDYRTVWDSLHEPMKPEWKNRARTIRDYLLKGRE